MTTPRHADQSAPYSRENYQEDAARTLSPEFHADAVYREAVDQLIQAIVEYTGDADGLDTVKRALFYGTREYKPVGWTDDGIPPLAKWETDALHGAIGIATEAGELLEAIWNNPIDAAHIREELGDLEWYMAILRRALGVSQEAIQRQNIAKLYARYPEKFTAEDAEDRDYDKEYRASNA